MTVLVAGATGLLGGAVARRLLADGQTVRALVRETSDRARVDALRRAGAEIAVGDLKRPPSLAAACEGAGAVVSTAQTIVARQPGDSIAAVDRDGQLSLVAAAEAAGVGAFVYLSFSDTIDFPFPFERAKRAVEARLRTSSLRWTILKPAQFMEVWFSPFLLIDATNARARLLGSGEQRISWIAVDDVARVAAGCVDEPRGELTFGGPEAVSANDVVRSFEKAAGREFEVERVPVEAIEAQRAAARDEYEESLACLLLAATREDVLPPLGTVTVEEFARAAVGG